MNIISEYQLIINKIGLIDPSIINFFIDKNIKGLTKKYFSYNYDKMNPYLHFIINLASMLLNENNIKHDNSWFIDIIQYNLNGDINIDSDLALHK